jgi:putative oxidoreductase
MARRPKILMSQWLLFIVFLFFGIAKLVISPEQTTDVFGKLGGAFGQYFTGVYQIIAAVLVLIPATAFIGALLVAICMIVAILLHLTILGLAGPFLVLTIVALVLLWISIKVMQRTRRHLFVR